ncbi:MAG: hypothetical protein M1831_000280 [Alyxoria varia]|nr:MAG: hypothetical protein M1831_000280 [Alyxoria varia]
MPPANSPANLTPQLNTSRSSNRTPSPSSFLPVLRDLGSPVLDLASTLTIQAEDDVDADNVNFLRSQMDPSDRPQEPSGRDASFDRRGTEIQNQNRSLSDEARERRLRDRHLRQHYDSHEAWAESMRNRAHSPYGDQPPNQQSLYDWAPASDEADEQELEQVMRELREQQPNTHPDILRVLGRAQLDSERYGRSNRQSARPAPHEGSLRSAAILQSVRRNRGLSARSRDMMQRYVMDRERTGQRDRAGRSTEDHDNPNTSRTLRVSSHENDGSRYHQNRATWQASQHHASTPPHQNRSEPTPQEQRQQTEPTADTLETLRQRYLEDRHQVPVSNLESIIHFLSCMRDPDLKLHVSEILPSLRQHSLDQITRMAQEQSSQLRERCRPRYTSWLTSGTTFSGFQEAAPTSSTFYRLSDDNPFTGNYAREYARLVVANSSSRTSASSRTNQQPAGPSLTRDSRSFHASGSSPMNPSSPDRWTVRVNIHSVDYDDMTLQGTMEAYNVPSIATTTSPSDANNSTLNSSGNATKTTFSTYLEGELIDFSKNTLLTESFKASHRIDATYWRKLEPFAQLSDEDIIANLLDPGWIEREVAGKYVLMRWKERCFVKETKESFSANGPHRRHGNGAGGGAGDGDGDGDGRENRANPTTSSSDGNGFGLSISGFYYISLRRSDGMVEGLYHDPQSSPYQHLGLMPECGGRWSSGVWEFR